MAQAERSAVGLRSERGPILLSLMLSNSLVALDSTIIATAVPSMVASLGGFSEFPWLFSVYLLAQAVSVPIYGRLSDLVGRKRILLVGIGLFLLGSLLSGIAWNMTALIVFRAVQGLGAGAIQPMGMTIAGDIYTVAERARVQGYLASVWAVSSVVGPTLGGIFSEYLSWRWIFYVNLPLCLLAAYLVRNLKEDFTRVRHRIDYLGATLLALGCGLLILGMLENGHTWSWVSLPGIGIPALGLVLVALFLLRQRLAPEPILPLWVLHRRVLATSTCIAVAIGALVLGLTTYVPTYGQGVLGLGPLAAGFSLATLTVGWPVAASLSGRLYLRIGFRRTCLVGAVTAVIGTTLAAVLWNADTSPWLVAGLCFVVGLGMGLQASPSLIVAQSSVGWSDRGVVTGTNVFGRSIGSSLGVALFGAVANAALPVVGEPTAQQQMVAFHRVFVCVAIIGATLLLLGALLPDRLPGRVGATDGEHR